MFYILIVVIVNLLKVYTISYHILSYVIKSYHIISNKLYALKLYDKRKLNSSNTGLEWPRIFQVLRFPDIMTMARMVLRLTVLRTGRLYPRKYSWYYFKLEAESIPEPYFDRKDFSSKNIPFTPAGIETDTIRFVVPLLNHCDTAVIKIKKLYLN